MKYTPKQTNTNHNVSPISPLKDFLWLMANVLLLIGGLYIVLGFAMDLVAQTLPASVERQLGNFFKPKLTSTAHPNQARLQALLEELVEHTENPAQRQLVIVPEKTPNAMALPGGVIVVHSGLVNKATSENELAFVLAHELGHYSNKDHLRGLGRGLVLVGISALLLGADNAFTQYLMQILTGVENKFSQRQELQADAYALELIEKQYGHVSGASDFFERMVEARQALPEWLSYFSTHPYPTARIEHLEQLQEEAFFSSGERTPWAPAKQPTQEKWWLEWLAGTKVPV